jgi:hypothetical protein
VLDTVIDLVGKVERRARKPWIIQQIISTVVEQRKNVSNEEERRNCRRLKNCSVSPAGVKKIILMERYMADHFIFSILKSVKENVRACNTCLAFMGYTPLIYICTDICS